MEKRRGGEQGFARWKLTQKKSTLCDFRVRQSARECVRIAVDGVRIMALRGARSEGSV